jgi:hypothetical protein
MSNVAKRMFDLIDRCERRQTNQQMAVDRPVRCYWRVNYWSALLVNEESQALSVRVRVFVSVGSTWNF